MRRGKCELNPGGQFIELFLAVLVEHSSQRRAVSLLRQRQERTGFWLRSIELLQGGIEITLGEAAAGDLARGGPQQPELRFRVWPVALIRAAAVKQDWLDHGRESFDAAGGQLANRLLDLLAADHGRGGRGRRGGFFRLIYCILQPPLEQLQGRIVRLQPHRLHELLRTARVQLVPQAPFGQLQMGACSGSRQMPDLEFIGFVQRAANGFHFAGFKANFAGSAQRHDVVIARLRHLAFQHLAIAQHEQPGLRLQGSLREQHRGQSKQHERGERIIRARHGERTLEAPPRPVKVNTMKIASITIRLLAVLSSLACIRVAARADELTRHARTELHMGVEFEAILYSTDAALADQALTTAMARVAALDKALSDYDLESELSRLSLTSTVPDPKSAAAAVFPAVKVSDDLWTVLACSQQISELSEGAFDVTVGPLTKLWRRARRQKALPERELFEPAKAAVGYRSLQLDPQARTARLLKPNMRLDLGAIAKGYAADEALAAMRKLGITRALVRASGDIACGEAPPGEAGWRIGIAPIDPDETPSRFVRLANRAISTSGDSRQHLEIDGKRYSHIIDPRTGLGVEGRSSVSVIAPRGITADGLATAVSILGPERGMDLIGKTDGAAFLMIMEDQPGKTSQTASPNFRQFEEKPEK